MPLIPNARHRFVLLHISVFLHKNQTSFFYKIKNPAPTKWDRNIKPAVPPKFAQACALICVQSYTRSITAATVSPNRNPAQFALGSPFPTAAVTAIPPSAAL